MAQPIFKKIVRGCAKTAIRASFEPDEKKISYFSEALDTEN